MPDLCRCGGLASGECSRCHRDLAAESLDHVDTGDDLICVDCLDPELHTHTTIGHTDDCPACQLTQHDLNAGQLTAA